MESTSHEPIIVTLRSTITWNDMNNGRARGSIPLLIGDKDLIGGDLYRGAWLSFSSGSMMPSVALKTEALDRQSGKLALEFMVIADAIARLTIMLDILFDVVHKKRSPDNNLVYFDNNVDAWRFKNGMLQKLLTDDLHNLFSSKCLPQQYQVPTNLMFEVEDISFNSPMKARFKLRYILITAAATMFCPTAATAIKEWSEFAVNVQAIHHTANEERNKRIDDLINDMEHNNKAIQTLLSNLHYYHGKIDGILGPLSNQAAESFCRDRGKPFLGVKSKTFLKQLAEATVTEGISPAK